MQEDESLVQLLLSPDEREPDQRIKTSHQTHSAHDLLYGVIAGLFFSFLFTHTGVLNNKTHQAIVMDETPVSTNGKLSAVPPDLESTNLAEYLHREVRVLCIMMTSVDALKTQGDIVMDTWGKRCNKFIFFSEQGDLDINSISGVVFLNETRRFAQLREALDYVNKNHLNDFDWVLKSNDISYVVMENLRHLLYQYDTDWPLVIGQRFLEEDYMTGVYAISRRALIRLINDGFTNKNLCDIDSDQDCDKAISKCFQHLNVLKVDGIDSTGRGQFFQNGFNSALFPEKTNDYDKSYWHKLNQGLNNCCSDRLVAVQQVYGTDLYYMEYFIYKVHAFGRHRIREPLPQKLTLEEVMKDNY